MITEVKRPQVDPRDLEQLNKLEPYKPGITLVKVLCAFRLVVELIAYCFRAPRTHHS